MAVLHEKEGHEHADAHEQPERDIHGSQNLNQVNRSDQAPAERGDFAEKTYTLAGGEQCPPRKQYTAPHKQIDDAHGEDQAFHRNPRKL